MGYTSKFLRGPWLRKAAKYLSSPARLRQLVAAVRQYASRKGLEQVRSELNLLAAMSRDVATGRYRDCRHSSVLLAVAALVYVVSPLDVVPDFIVALGMLDDVAIVTWALTRLSDEVERYRQACAGGQMPGTDTPSTPPMPPLPNKNIGK